MPLPPRLGLVRRLAGLWLTSSVVLTAFLVVVGLQARGARAADFFPYFKADAATQVQMTYPGLGADPRIQRRSRAPGCDRMPGE